MKKIFTTIFLFFTILNIFSQSNFYYYYKGGKVPLVLDKRYVNVFTEKTISLDSTSQLNFKDYKLNSGTGDKSNDLNWGKLEFETEPTDIEYIQKVNTLKSNKTIYGIGAYFKKSDAQSIGLSNIFYVKLKDLSDTTSLNSVSKYKNVTILEQNKFMPLWYTLKRNKNTIENSLELSNYFYETGLFDDVDPAFMFDFKIDCSTDPLYTEQWGLQNDGYPNFDINITDAWNLSQGQNVKVAVFDQGVDLIHEDLISNIYPLSYDTNTGNPQATIYGIHGTHVAGIIGALKDNNIDIAGVAPLSKIISVSNPFAIVPNITSKLADGINWAWQNGAEIINNSWGDQGGSYYNNIHSTILENALTNALTLGRNGLGCVVTFVSGNFAPAIDYPGNSGLPNLLCIGSTTQLGVRSTFSGYGDSLDLVAPGSDIMSLVPSNGFGNMSGTSMAAPHVSGVAALILSINPCLSNQQVNNILELTAQKINTYSYGINPLKPNGTWNNEMGYGLLDAYASVQMAKSMQSDNLDLYVKDGQDDVGIEPNTVTQYMWTSDNIWVRNNNDSGLTHENPDYSANGNPNYVKVRVTNKSCVASTGNEQLNLYWAKASTALGYPNPWTGGIYNSTTGAIMGSQIGQLNIPVIEPGQEAILSFPWIVPNPADYGNDGDQWHFCLLTRIEATNDPMTFPETWDLNSNVRNNNNIAWKNVTVVDVLPNNIINPGGIVAVGNPFDYPKTFFLEMEVTYLETGKPIYEEAEVGVKMDDALYSAWERGGKEAQKLDPTIEEKRKMVKGNHVILDNLSFDANQLGTLRLDFNFLTKEMTNKSNYVYHVIQKDIDTGNIIGGETFVINKHQRAKFEADAGGDKKVDLNQAITISAKDINEPAIYNWYDSEGNLIYQGKNLEIASAIAEKYKLEVISTVDGFKDYTEVEVKLNPSILGNISPNPANDHVLISYKLNGADSAYLMIIGYYGSNGTSNNYILDLNSSETNLDVSNYPCGFFTVALVVNGEIIDAKTLIKE